MAEDGYLPQHLRARQRQNRRALGRHHRLRHCVGRVPAAGLRVPA